MPSLFQIIICCLFSPKPLSEPMMIYQLDLSNKTLWHSNKNTKIFKQEYEFQNIICKTAAIFSKYQCIKSCYMQHGKHDVRCQGPLLLTWFNLNPAWIGNHLPGKVWDEINYPFLNFNGYTVEVKEWISDFIQHFIMDVIMYPCWK